MAGLIMVIIGLVISTIDIPIVKIADYPEYTILYEQEGLGEVIQEYVAHNMIGSELKLDILPDVLAYLLMFVGSCMLLKYSVKFIKVWTPLLATVGLSVYMKIIPFVYEGKDLIVYGLAVSAILVIVEILMEYLLVYTIADATADLPNQRDTVLMKFGWIGSVLCRGFLYFIVLVGLAEWIIIVYKIVQIGFMAFCIDRMFRCRHYLKADNDGKCEV